MLPAARWVQELEEVPMAIVGGIDVHRGQLTYDYLETDIGEIRRGQVRPANRKGLCQGTARSPGGRTARLPSRAHQNSWWADLAAPGPRSLQRHHPFARGGLSETE